MHQEREFPGRVAATDLANPDFAALARACGAWAARVETADEFAAALREAMGRGGLRLLHCLTDIERLNAAGVTVSALRSR
jgi:acetolactate synthase-1/2/3 large subunit